MNEYIGATGNYPIIEYVDYTSNNNFLFTSNTSNYLNKRIDDIDIETSNISSNISDIYTQGLRNELWEVNPNNSKCLIKSRSYLGLTHTYINNSNIDGEIRFYTFSSSGFNLGGLDHNTKIDYLGRLKVYHNYDLTQPTILAGWYDVDFEIAQIKADGVNTDIQLTVLDAAVTDIQTVQLPAITTALATYGNLIGNTQLITESLTDELDFLITTEQLELIRNRTNNYNQLAESLGGFINAPKNFISKGLEGAGELLQIGSIGAIGFGVCAGLGALGEWIKLQNVASNITPSNFTITPTQRRQLLDSNISNQILIMDDIFSNFSNVNIIQGFINSNITTTQFIPSLKSNKIMLGNITTPNIAYQMEMTGDLNLNMLYLNSTSLTSLLNQKQGNLTFNNPLLNTTNIITLKRDSSLTLDGSGNLSVVKTATTPIVITGNDFSLSYDSSLTKVGNNLSVVKTASLPLAITGNNWALNYDSTLELSGNNLKVAAATSSKWAKRNSALLDDIYNLNVRNVGIGTDQPGTKLDVNGGITARGDMVVNFNQNDNAFFGMYNYYEGALANVLFLFNTYSTSGRIELYNALHATTPNLLKISNSLGDIMITNGVTDPLIYLKRSTGNIGIGNINPSYKLDVNGNIYGRNNLYVGNSTFNYTNATINTITGTEYQYLIYTTNGTLVLNESLNCDILIVGGGGSGGSRHAGGGGAGAVIYLTNRTLTSGTYNITIGNGGAAVNIGNGSTTSLGNPGQDTTIALGSTIVYKARGGGYGGSIGITGGTGGSSGGSTGAVQTQGPNVATDNIPAGAYGNIGGKGSPAGDASVFGGGGGGGAGAAGGDANQNAIPATGGNGGNGTQIAITGINTYYGGGGGGGIASTGNTAGTGGLGGGGAGSKGAVKAGNGAANTGGGGGGSGFIAGTNTNGESGAGGSGVVIIRFIETGKLGLGTTTPNNKLHIEKGSAFIGDSSVGNGVQVDNSYKLIFDNSYTTNGTNKCNKIVLHNNQSGIGYLAGFGVEGGGLAYSTWTSGKHKFYTETTSTSGGFLSFDILREQFNFYGNVDGSAGGFVRNASAGGSAHTYLGLLNNNSSFGGFFLNSSARTADGGANNMTVRNDAGDLILSAKGSTPQIYLQESTDRIYMNGIVNIRQGSGGGSYVVPNNHMQDGSLTIGSINLNYGLGSALNTNCAGLMLECSDNTEIAVHDYGLRLTSLMAFQGGSSYNNITIGRDMGGGWGTAWNVNIAGASLSLANEWYIVKGTTPTSVPNSLIFLHSTGTITSRWWLNGTQNGTSSEISDERIKKEINDIDNPLEKLLLIKPKEYYLCSDKDYNKKYGVIAQDINKEESLKHLIYTDKEYIANLLTNAKFIKEKIGEEEVILEYPEDKYIKSEDNPTPYQRPKPKEIFKYTIITDKNLSATQAEGGLINIDDELKIVLDNDDIDNIEIVIDDTPYNNRYKKRFIKVKEIIDDYSFEIYEDIDITETEKDNLFIYGKKVDDFLKLDYQSLYCLNIKATQELIRKNAEQEKRIEKLEELINNFLINK